MLECNKVGNNSIGGGRGRPVCLQLSEQPALRVGRGRHGSSSVVCSCGGITKSHGRPAPLRTPLCSLGSCVEPTGNVECPCLLSVFFCAHRSLGRRMLCGLAVPEVHSFPTNPCVPAPCFPCPSSLVFFSFSLSLSLKTRVQRITFLGW